MKSSCHKISLTVIVCLLSGALVVSAQLPKPNPPPNPRPPSPPTPAPQRPGAVPQTPTPPGSVPQLPGAIPQPPGAVPQTPGGVPPNVGAVPPGGNNAINPAGGVLPPQQPLPPNQFVGQTALSGLREIRLAQIAQQRSQNPQIQRFAQEILTQQAANNRRLSELAQSRGFALPPNNAFESRQGNLRDRDVTPQQPIRDPQQPDNRAGQDRLSVRDPFAISDEEREAFTRLQGLSGAEFDQAFMEAIVQDRMQGVQRFEQAAQSIDDPELKRLIGDRLPTLRESHGTALRLNETLGTARPGQTIGAPPNPNQIQRPPQN